MSHAGLAQLANLGPKSAEWLAQAGIHSFEDLKKLGAVRAFLRVQDSGKPASLNLLFALDGAIHNCHWHDVVKQRKESLLLELESVKEWNAQLG